MSAVTGGMGRSGRRPVLMDFSRRRSKKLIEEFARLPGIGQKTAQRLAFHVLDLPKRGCGALRGCDTGCQKAKTFTCKRCQNLTDTETCPICADQARDQKTICVVTDPRDVIAFERTREYKGAVPCAAARCRR